MALVLASALPALAVGCGGSSPTLDASDGRAGDLLGDVQDTCGSLETFVREKPSDSSARWSVPECLPSCPSPPDLKWVLIPGGTFSMGCSPEEEHCQIAELPAHSVTLSSFEMCETEVTEAQYVPTTEWNPSCNVAGGGGPDNPVECVNWFDAKLFCEGIGGRLPTEAEWEYAARGGTKTTYYCGDDASCLDGIGWYDGNSSGMKHPVKMKGPNGYGLYDMLGNVWEWTNDWYDESYYESSPSSDPQGPDSGTSRVGRGGGFGDFYGIRVSGRSGYDPAGDYGNLGFRCARSVEP